MQLAIESYEKCIQLDNVNKNAGQNRLLALNYIYPGEEAYVCSEHEAWGQEFQARYQMLPEVGSETKSRSEQETLTVGYVSPDLFTHSVSYFAEAPLAHHTKRPASLLVLEVVILSSEQPLQRLFWPCLSSFLSCVTAYIGRKACA